MVNGHQRVHNDFPFLPNRVEWRPLVKQRRVERLRGRFLAGAAASAAAAAELGGAAAGDGGGRRVLARVLLRVADQAHHLEE